MDASSSETVKFITGWVSPELPFPTVDESFAILQHVVEKLDRQEILTHVVNLRMGQSYKELDLRLALFKKSQEHGLSGLRLQLIYNPSWHDGSTDPDVGGTDYFFLTEKKEWFWIRQKGREAGKRVDPVIMQFEPLRPEHNSLFKQFDVANPEKQRVAFHLLSALLARIDAQGQDRIDRGQRLQNATAQFWPYVGRAKQAGYDEYMM